MTRIAVIGGGPGGLITAYLLERKYKDSCQTTLFEASERVGGKILTRRFDCVPEIYEAGVAEVYDYGMIGPDPLQQLIAELGLKTTPIDGRTVVLDGTVLRDEREVGKHCGANTLEAIEDFRRRAVAMMPIDMWHGGSWEDDNKHPWSRLTCEDILNNEVADPTARKYLKVAVHSDLATEPHLTNGLNGLKNFVMDVPGYVRQHSIEGGMEMLPKALRERLTGTRVKLNSPVVRVEKQNDSYRISFRRGREIAWQDFDAVFISLPHNWLTSVEWGGERLRRAMSEHIAYYDRPAHYLRVTILFKKPFWRGLVNGSWFMLDAFGGGCVYDESARHEAGEYGVLGWLMAGADALSLINLDDRTLVNCAIESLPDELYEEARGSFIEGKVHRWAAAVNALPGGCPARAPRSAHLPEAEEHPGILIVGDYLFDSTLNGVFDSANFATDLLCSRLHSLTGDTAAGRFILREQSATYFSYECQ